MADASAAGLSCGLEGGYGVRMGNPVPAICQIDNCGVLATGRCSICGLAFCRSHQAPYSATEAVNTCSQCALKESEELQRRQRKSAEEAHAGRVRAHAEEEQRRAGLPPMRSADLVDFLATGLAIKFRVTDTAAGEYARAIAKAQRRRALPGHARLEGRRGWGSWVRVLCLTSRGDL